MDHEQTSVAEALVYVVRALERVEERLSVLDTVPNIDARLCALHERVEKHLTHRRKTPNARVREAHIKAIGAMGGACPFCDAPLFDCDGRFVGVIHHVDRASDASLDATMPTCGPCNLRFNVQPTPRAVVDAYHLRRARVSGPLFAVRRRQ